MAEPDVVPQLKTKLIGSLILGEKRLTDILKRTSLLILKMRIKINILFCINALNYLSMCEGGITNLCLLVGLSLIHI